MCQGFHQETLPSHARTARLYFCMCTVIKMRSGCGRCAENCDANGGIRQVNIFLMRAERVGKCADEAVARVWSGPPFTKGSRCFRIRAHIGRARSRSWLRSGLSMSQRCAGDATHEVLSRASFAGPSVRMSKQPLGSLGQCRRVAHPVRCTGKISQAKGNA